MEHRFDSLARSVSGAMSRRQAFWQLGRGLVLSVLAAAGIGAARQQQPCEQLCALNCIDNHPHHEGTLRAECIRLCIAAFHESGVCHLPAS